MTRHACLPLLAGLLLVAAGPPAQAASDCQPLFDAYAAQMRLPAFRKTVVTPGMAAPVELIMTSGALYSRVGPDDPWSKVPLDTTMRELLRQGSPTPQTVTECRRIGAREIGGVAAMVYEFTPPAASGNAPGEKLTVLIGRDSGLPLSETAAKAGTRATIVYEGFTVPAP